MHSFLFVVNFDFVPASCQKKKQYPFLKRLEFGILPFLHLHCFHARGRKSCRGGGEKRSDDGRKAEKDRRAKVISPSLSGRREWRRPPLSLSLSLLPSPPLSRPLNQLPCPSSANTASTAAKNPTSAAFAAARGAEFPLREAEAAATPAHRAWNAPRAATRGFSAPSVSSLIAPIRDQSPEYAASTAASTINATAPCKGTRNHHERETEATSLVRPPLSLPLEGGVAGVAAPPSSCFRAAAGGGSKRGRAGESERRRLRAAGAAAERR